MNSINYSVKNQAILKNTKIIITSGEASAYNFLGDCIISPYPYNHGEHYFFIQDADRLISTFPSILKFEVYEYELY